MKNRINIQKTTPAAYAAMFGLEKLLKESPLTQIHKELIKIRASQINGCAYCLSMHCKDALALGETAQRIHTLSAWRETNFFNEEEQAILALTEEVTLITHHVSDEVYERAAGLFDEIYLASILMAIVTINSWNRIAISTRMMPA